MAAGGLQSWASAWSRRRTYRICWRWGVLVVGFLPGYWREKGYDGGRRFRAAQLAAGTLADARRPGARSLMRGAGHRSLVAGAGISDLLLALRLRISDCTPIYSWNALPFVVLVIMAGRLEWLSVWPALYVAFVFDHETWVQALAFGTALAVVAIVGFIRRGRTRRFQDSGARDADFATLTSGYAVADARRTACPE
jgi:hypothetical protein